MAVATFISLACNCATAIAPARDRLGGEYWRELPVPGGAIAVAIHLGAGWRLRVRAVIERRRSKKRSFKTGRILENILKCPGSMGISLVALLALEAVWRPAGVGCMGGGGFVCKR